MWHAFSLCLRHVRRHQNGAVPVERRASRKRAAREGGASKQRERAARVDGASGRRERAARKGGAKWRCADYVQMGRYCWEVQQAGRRSVASMLTVTGRSRGTARELWGRFSRRIFRLSLMIREVRIHCWYPRARGRFPGRTCHDTSLKRSIEARDEDARTSPPRTMEATGAGVGTARGKQARAASPLFGALSAAPPSFLSPALPVLFRPPHQGRPSPFRRRGPRKRRARVRGRRAGSKRERPPLSLALSARRRRRSYHPHSPSFFAPPIKTGPLPNPNHPNPNRPKTPPL